VVSVIASSVRKGNVLEKDGKLYLVIGAENIHPGKGTPVTHLEMRRISDGVKTVERLRTTDSVEKAFVEHQTFNYLYQDGEQYIFMQPQTFDQLHVSSDVVGDKIPYLTENMEVQLQLFEGNAISIEIPQRATFEIVDTEPVVKGQTASGSFKPALLSNGRRRPPTTPVHEERADHENSDDCRHRRDRIVCGPGLRGQCRVREVGR